jgi:hypothetical protein
MLSINYVHNIDCTETRSSWTGSEDAAIKAAEAELNAEPQDGGMWTYHAGENGVDYQISRKAMLAAGAAILDGATDWYSSWCANFEAVEVRAE